MFGADIVQAWFVIFKQHEVAIDQIFGMQKLDLVITIADYIDIYIVFDPVEEQLKNTQPTFGDNCARPHRD